MGDRLVGDVSDTKQQPGPAIHIDPDVVLLDEVTVGPGAVILGRSDGSRTATVVHAKASIGANATIWGGVEIGHGAVVRPGSVVSRSVPPLAIVEGNPARIVGYVDADDATTAAGPPRKHSPGDSISSAASRVRGVRLQQFNLSRDLRGSLAAAEFDRDTPFRPVRHFVVFNVPTAETRGEHAHRQCEQLLCAVNGRISVVADDGHQRQEFLLSRPDIALYIPAMVWAVQYRYSRDAVLLVLASHHYDAADYVRDYDEFLRMVAANHPTFRS